MRQGRALKIIYAKYKHLREYGLPENILYQL